MCVGGISRSIFPDAGLSRCAAAHSAAAVAGRVPARLAAHPRLELCREEVGSLEARLAAHPAVIVASGPLTSPELAAALQPFVGEHTLYFHDAIAPVVSADSIDRGVAFAASRYGKGSADYLNCPLSAAEYRAFVAALAAAETVAFHPFESLRPFEGCLPIEIMAARGYRTLLFGPMKPVGRVDPRTGHAPFAVGQLRQEDRAGTLYNLVGFQTKMTWPEQRRILRTIPGLEHAEFVRLGSLHRNTFVNAPLLLDEELALRERLEQSGRRPTPPIDRFWFTSVYFLEPGGVLFELATDGPGFGRDEAADRLGGRLILPPWLEGRRTEIARALPPLVLPDD